MSEIRQDVTTNEWVIIATERAKRPHDFKTPKKELPPEHVESCPFCPGNESMTPPEVMAYREGAEPDGPGWRLRVVPNRFAALMPDGDLIRTFEDHFFRKMHGTGHHEVLIETPVHNLYLPSQSDSQVEEVMLALRDRYLALREEPNIRVIIIFKNHGQDAGTSLEHPHFQIVGTPIVPQSLRRRLAVATRYYDDQGGCLYCDMIQVEREAKKRVVMEQEGYIVFHPYASRSPFETWIIPAKHSASYGLTTPEQARALGRVVEECLARVFTILGNPDFNMVFHNAPIKDENEDFFHWYLKIIPRIAKVAGFEIGSGIFINVALPEQTAEYMREVGL